MPSLLMRWDSVERMQILSFLLGVTSMRRIRISSIAAATTMLSVVMMTSGMAIASLSGQDQRPRQSRVDRAPGPRDTNPFRSLMKQRRPDQPRSLKTDRAPRTGTPRPVPKSDRANRPDDRSPKPRMGRAPGSPGRNANRPGQRGPQQGRGMQGQRQPQMQEMMQRMMMERFGQGAGPRNGVPQQGRGMQGPKQNRGMQRQQQPQMQQQMQQRMQQMMQQMMMERFGQGGGPGMRGPQQRGPGMRGMMQTRPNSRRPQNMQRQRIRQPRRDCSQCPMNRRKFNGRGNRQGPPQQRMNRPQNNRRRPTPPNDRPARRQSPRRPVI